MLELARKLRELAQAATPGPWQWFGNTKTYDVYLATVNRGRVLVMDFFRWGMTGAQPRFQVRLSGEPGSGVMRSVGELGKDESPMGPRFEVPYRRQFVGIGHPDAEWIAAANPTAVLSLLDELDCSGKGCGTDESKACLRCCRILIANGRANHGDVCDAENQRLRECLQRASSNHERFERLFYLALGELEDTGGDFATSKAEELRAEASP